MKRIIALFTTVILITLCASPVLAQGLLSISPPSVEFDVPADGSTEVEFLVNDFTGDLQISLEDIPLTVEPTTVPVTEEGSKIVLTLYGDESLGSQVFNGKIRFLAMTGETVAMGIKVKATINHVASGEPLPEQSPPEPTPPAPPGSPPTPPETTELNIPLLAGIAAGTIIVITLIIVLARRQRY
ncbi:hypothetical protein ES707_01945 [subsurface metagenome]